ncbi:MAG: histidinol-phosphate transaminase [Puniceicoccales bacterium]|jgi:histidinol-phosphate aminotransferase|nr:histidinol-phosphate transaminase [Puniceicoccales bacterium]
MTCSTSTSFDVSRYVSAAIGAQSAYTPGDQPQDTGWIKLNTNENPYPPSPRVIEAIQREAGTDGAKLRLYPSPASNPLREAAARYHGLTPDRVLAGNGSDDVLNLLIRTFSSTDKPAGMLDPSYSLYPVLSGLNAATMIRVPVGIDGDFDIGAIEKSGANIFFLTNPNAPLGIAFSLERIREVLSRLDGIVVVDEAYAPFADHDATRLLAEYPNLVITRTFSKAYALAGLRIGYALGHPSVIATLHKVRDSYNLDRLAQAAGVAALEDRAYYDGIVAKIKQTRDDTAAQLRALGWRVLPSQANFLMVEPVNPKTGEKGPAVAAALFDYFKARKILVRYFPANPLTAPFLRISIGDIAEMKTVLNVIATWAP